MPSVSPDDQIDQKQNTLYKLALIEEIKNLMKTLPALSKPFTLLFLPWLVSIHCSPEKTDQSALKEKSMITAVPVEVAVVERKNLSMTKTYSGTLEGEDQANIVAKISERITGITVKIGESVSAGQVIINLDKSGTASQYYQAEANYKNAEKNLQRMKSLYAEGAISQQSLDGGQTAYDVAKANFDAARSAVELATPISGEVTAINASVGDLTVPGSVLITIARISRLKMIFNINETDVTSISLNQKVHVYSDAKPDERVEGRIIQLSQSADIRSRTFEIKALFPNTRDKWFKPGMFCKVEIQLAPRENVLTIPNPAIQSDGLTYRVYVIQHNQAFQRSIQVGVTDRQITEIIQGLSEGDTVATLGVNSLQDSSLVNIVNSSN
jgi:membrane fusion protein (multidrug efflux system)